MLGHLDLDIREPVNSQRGQWSMIYDAIHNTVSPMETASNTLTFYRTIVITDGVDQTQTGVTMEPGPRYKRTRQLPAPDSDWRDWCSGPGRSTP